MSNFGDQHPTGNSLIDLDDDEQQLDPEIVLQQILDDPNLTQHVTRSEHEGRETIAGYFRIKFEPGQQRQVLHVPFAPALRSIPTVDAQATDRDNVRVRVTDCQKFGIRTEIIKADQSETVDSVFVEILATESE